MRLFSMPDFIKHRLIPQSLYQRMQLESYACNDFVRKHISLLTPGSLILDAGAGSIEERRLPASMTSNFKYHACDIALRTGLTYVTDLHSVSIHESIYDSIFCTQVLEHVRYPQKVCSELYRILKPGGQLFITVPQMSGLHEIPNHYFNYTCYGLRLLLEDAGFDILELTPQGGHFYCLGIQLHLTCKVIYSAMDTSLKRIILYPIYLSCRVIFGLMTKIMCIWMDRFDKDVENALGWNCRCRKPA